jgi:hypothetical protein
MGIVPDELSGVHERQSQDDVRGHSRSADLRRRTLSTKRRKPISRPRNAGMESASRRFGIGNAQARNVFRRHRTVGRSGVVTLRRMRRWPEAASAGGNSEKATPPVVAQVAAVANASTAAMNIAVSNFDRAYMWITPRFHQNYSNYEGFIKPARLWKTTLTGRFHWSPNGGPYDRDRTRARHDG